LSNELYVSCITENR